MMHLSIILILTLNILTAHGGIWSKGRDQNSDESGESIPCLCLSSSKCPGQEIVELNKDCRPIDGVDIVCCPKPDQPEVDPSKHLTKDPSQTAVTIPSKNPAHSQGPDNTSSSTSNCNCILESECYDEEFSDKTLEQESCEEPDHVCCQELVQSQQPGVSHTTTQNPILNQSPQPQPTNPTLISPSPDYSTCTCIPFFSCYDEETSSNLTGLVNDRTGNQVNPSEVIESTQSPTTIQCQGPNDVCCYNQINPSEVIESTKSPTTITTDCTGSCVSIFECPVLADTLKSARAGNKQALQKLRKSVCSKQNELLHVCCPQKGSPPCQFPFIFKGVTYSECTSINDSDGELWCSTKTDDQRNHVNDQWKHCTPKDALGK